MNLLADIARDATVIAALRRDLNARPAPSFEEVRNEDVVHLELTEWAMVVQQCLPKTVVIAACGRTGQRDPRQLRAVGHGANLPHGLARPDRCAPSHFGEQPLRRPRRALDSLVPTGATHWVRLVQAFLGESLAT